MSHLDYSGWEAVRLEPKEATREEWDLFHAYRRVRHEEVRPDDPLTPDEIVEMNMKKDDPFGESRYYVVYADGRQVAGIGLGTMKPNAPGYESNKNYLWGGGGVIRDYRRRGIGTLWLFKLLETMKEWDKTLATTSTEEGDGIAFFEWLGLEPKQIMDENRLDFRKVDWKMVETWIEEGKKKSPDAKIEIFEDRLPEDIWEEYTPELSRLVNTMPFDDLEHGDIVLTPEVLKEQYERLDAMQAQHHTVIVREADGRISGMTDVNWMPSKEHYVEQVFTGVDPDARGRGLGKLLKALMLDLLRRRYEEIHWVVTGNANSNAAMLAINRKLGFKLHKPHRAYQIGREALEKFLADNG